MKRNPYITVSLAEAIKTYGNILSEDEICEVYSRSIEQYNGQTITVEDEGVIKLEPADPNETMYFLPAYHKEPMPHEKRIPFARILEKNMQTAGRKARQERFFNDFIYGEKMKNDIRDDPMLVFGVLFKLGYVSVRGCYLDGSIDKSEGIKCSISDRISDKVSKLQKAMMQIELDSAAEMMTKYAKEITYRDRGVQLLYAYALVSLMLESEDSARRVMEVVDELRKL